MNRIGSAVALAGVSVAVGAALGGVFTGPDWAAPVIAAALLPHLLGWTTRRRGGIVAALVAAAGLVGFAIWVLTPGATRGGLVDGHTLEVLRRHLAAGWTALRHTRAPIPSDDGPVLLAVIAVWCMATTADLVARHAARPLGALGPGITLFIWVAALSGAPSGNDRLMVAVALAATGAAYVVAREHEVRPLGPAVIVGTVGITAVLAALAVALTLTLPDPAAWSLVDRTDRGQDLSYRTAVPPLVDVADSLHRGEQVEMFTVVSPVRSYWRIAALDQYRSDGGGQWTLSASGGAVTNDLPGASSDAGTFTQRFRIGPLSERWVPAAYQPLQVRGTDVLVVQSSSTLVTTRASVSGLDYRVVSAREPIADARVRAATNVAIPASLRDQLALPSTIPAAVRELAAQVTAGAATRYDRALALRDFFRNGSFVYDTSVDLQDDVNGITTFLRDRRGFCVQFASTYALMARSLGIPARVAVGFTPGQFDSRTATYHVTNFDAHAWPEVWLPGIGWTGRFDPTPPSALPGGSDGASDGTATPPPAATTPSTEAPPATTPPVTTPVAAPTQHGSGLLTTVALVVVLLGGLVAAAVGGLVGIRRRRRARRRLAPTPDARVAGAWAEAVDRLREIGAPVPRAATPRELVTAAAPWTGPDATRALHEVASLYVTVRYGRSDPSTDLAPRAWEALETAEQALAAWTDGPARTRVLLGVGARHPADPPSARASTRRP